METANRRLTDTQLCAESMRAHRHARRVTLAAIWALVVVIVLIVADAAARWAQ